MDKKSTNDMTVALRQNAVRVFEAAKEPFQRLKATSEKRRAKLNALWEECKTEYETAMAQATTACAAQERELRGLKATLSQKTEEDRKAKQRKKIGYWIFAVALLVTICCMGNCVSQLVNEQSPSLVPILVFGAITFFVFMIVGSMDGYVYGIDETKNKIAVAAAALVVLNKARQKVADDYQKQEKQYRERIATVENKISICQKVLDLYAQKISYCFPGAEGVEVDEMERFLHTESPVLFHCDSCETFSVHDVDLFSGKCAWVGITVRCSRCERPIAQHMFLNNDGTPRMFGFEFCREIFPDDDDEYGDDDEYDDEYDEES